MPDAQLRRCHPALGHATYAGVTEEYPAADAAYTPP